MDDPLESNQSTLTVRRLRGVFARRPQWSGVLRGVVVFLCCLVIATPWAVFGASADSTFGPHEAEYAVTADGAIDVDLGPLGSVVVPADGLVPFGLGVHIKVGEIPTELGVGGSTIDALGGDITAYAALFSDPSAQVRTVVVAIVQDIALRGIVGSLALFALIVGGRALVGVSRWDVLRNSPQRQYQYQHQYQYRHRHRPRLQAGVAVTGLAILAGTFAVPFEPARTIESDPVFIGTPLAGSEVTGRLSGLVDEAAQAATDLVQENEKFYGGVRENLAAEWPQRPLSTRLGPGALNGLASASETDLATVVWTSDIHCQTGMSRVIGDVVRWTNADLHIDGGDITMTGTDAENVCVDSLQQALPADVPTVFVKGNHDSRATVRRAREVGWTIMEGEPVEVAGLTLFGAGDPRRTVFPTGDVLETGETTEQFATRVAVDACRADAGLLLIHDPRHAEPALAAGCADYGLHGHWHRRVEPERYGQGVRTVGSTTGGALADALTPGPLKMSAEMSVLRIDRTTGEPVDIQYITVGMDASVEFSTWVPFVQPGPPIMVDPEPQAEPDIEPQIDSGAAGDDEP